MKHLLLVSIAILVCGTWPAAAARWTAKPKRTTTTTTVAPSTVAATTPQPAEDSDSLVVDAAPPTVLTPADEKTYHPAEVQKPRLIERSDQRHFDGHYEYRYVQSNGDTRYERSYWQQVGKKKALVRKGYYSYPMPNNKYMTVFYTADENGFHEDSATYSQTQPVLPRSLDAPESVPIEDVKPVVKPIVNPVVKPVVKPVVSPISGNKKPRPTRPKRPVAQKKNAVNAEVTELPDDTTEFAMDNKTVE